MKKSFLKLLPFLPSFLAQRMTSAFVRLDNTDTSIPVTLTNRTYFGDLLDDIQRKFCLSDVPQYNIELIFDGKQVNTETELEGYKGRLLLKEKIIVKVRPSGKLRFYTNCLCLAGRCCGHKGMFTLLHFYLY